MRGRIREIRKHSKLTQEAFGDRIGLTRGAVSSIEYGTANPTEIVIKSICREFGVDYGWLKNGVGEMFASEEDEVMAALDVLMTGDTHEKTKAMIKALARMRDDELDAIDAYIEVLMKELGH